MPLLVPRKLNHLSIIIPIYNEEYGIPALRQAVEDWLPSLHGLDTEIVLVDDGSKDDSLSLCVAWAQTTSCVKVISFSRNFGHQQAVSAGLQYASGEAVVIIDADLQDPLVVIPEMILRYEEGYDVVYGQRRTRIGETWFKLMTAWGFYRLMRWCVHSNMPVDTGDFRLVSRQCVEALNAMPETHRFLRGLFAWAGFNQIAVSYDRQERLHGVSKYPLCKMLHFAWRGITSFSTMPIRVVSLSGGFIALCGSVTCMYALASHFAGTTVPGWTSLMGLLSVIGGMVMLSVGIIGEYVGNIYEEVKRRPLYLVQHTFNIDTKYEQNPHG